MAQIGIVRNSRKQQRINAELEMIIEKFGQAMRDAFKPYIVGHLCGDINLTSNMKCTWWEYVDWCRKYGDKK